MDARRDYVFAAAALAERITKGLKQSYDKAAHTHCKQLLIIFRQGSLESEFWNLESGIWNLKRLKIPDSYFCAA